MLLIKNNYYSFTQDDFFEYSSIKLCFFISKMTFGEENGRIFFVRGVWHQFYKLLDVWGRLKFLSLPFGSDAKITNVCFTLV
jgi:hypothetical protein